MSREEHENALVEAARKGDEQAFEAIMRLYMPKALAFVRQMTGGGEDAEDIVQEAFIKAYRGLDSFKGESSFRTWFFRVVSNSCLDHLRKKSLISRIFFFSRAEDDEEDGQEDVIDCAPDMNPSSMPDADMNRGELGRALNAAICKLSSRQRAVFLLKHQEDMKITDIAVVLNISEGAVKSHLSRAIATLREEMKGY